MTENRETAERRLAMRSMRRGIKEMDLILSDYASRHLTSLTDADLGLYDQLLEENDHDIYAWINGQAAAPGVYADLVGRIAQGAKGIVRPA